MEAANINQLRGVERWALAVGLGCIALMWLLPNHYAPWTSFYSDSMAACALLLLAVANQRSMRWRRVPAAAWVVLGSALLPWLHWAVQTPPFAGDAWIATLYVLGFGLAITVGNAWAGRGVEQAGGWLAGAVVVAAAVSSALALAQAFEFREFGIWMLDGMPGMRPYANLAQPNNFATLTGLGAVCLLLLREQGRLGAPASMGVAILLVVGAAVSQSRAALFFGPAILLGWWFAQRRRIVLAVSPWAIGAFTGLHWLATWTWPQLQLLLMSQATQSLAERGASSVRFEVWPMLIAAVMERPWFGYGWLQVGAAQLAVSERFEPVGEVWLQGHNLFLELIVWCGIPLGIALCAAIVYWLVTRWRWVGDRESLVGLLVVSLLGIHSMLELPYHYAYFLIPAGLWIGIVEHRGHVWRTTPSRWILVPAVLGVVLLGAIWKDYPKVEEDFRLVRFENMRIGSLRAEAPAPDAPFLSSLTEFLRFARTEPHADMSADELDRMEASVTRYPYAASLYRFGVALALNGQLPKAQQQFVRMRHIHGDQIYQRLKAQLAESASTAELQVLLDKLSP